MELYVALFVDEDGADRNALAAARQMYDGLAQEGDPSFKLPKMTAFEPEARGHLIEGMPFHQFYFQQEPARDRRQTTISSPHVRQLGPDAAVIAYTRLIQRADEAGNFSTVKFEETRVWQRIDGTWQHVHFHRSANE